MPYFIYSVQPAAQLQQLGQCVTYTEAARQARALRAAQAAQEARRIRIIFADTSLAAEDLLLQVRDAPPDGDD
jgi:hypothetical protein